MDRRFPQTFLFGLLTVIALSSCVPDRLIFSNPKPLEFKPLPPGLNFQEVLFPSGNLHLYGWHLPGEKGRPLVLYFHGTGTNLGKEISTLRHLRNNLGVSVFAFDYRGFGRSEGHPSVAGTRTDAQAALSFLTACGWPLESLVYYGHSLGAAVALDLALKNPPAALVLEAPFTSLLDLIGWHRPTAGAWLSWVLPDYYNNLAKIGRLQTPLLLIHGAADAKVPPAMARLLFDRAPGPKSLLLLAGGNHEAPRLAGSIAYWSGWRRFLDRCLADPCRMPVDPAIQLD